jgi:hypothetical protein
MIYTVRPGQVTFGQAIGIIMMDSFMPFPPGTPGNATTFSYPVLYEIVRGADMEHLVYQGDQALLEPFLEAGRKLVKAGVRAVTGNCGFMILFQEALAKELPVPVFMSGLLQLPFVARLLQPDQEVGIISASRESLTPEHLRIALGGMKANTVIAGMEDQPAFHAAIHAEVGELDFERIEREVVAVAGSLIREHPNVGALLFECTDLPPYAAAVQEATGLPVFDYSTLIDYVFSAVVRRPFAGYM